jgi:antagonist of KipI
MSAIQDAGRRGWEHLGIPRGGATDFLAYSWSNCLAQNEPGMAVIESLLQGLTLKVLKDTYLSTAGFAEVKVDGETLPGWAGFPVHAGSTMSCGTPEGARGYLAVHGGVLVPEALGSRSTNLESRFGGFEGRPLETGDTLAVGTWTEPPLAISLRHSHPPSIQRPLTARVVMGPGVEEFSSRSVGDFLATTYTMSPQSNHVGIRVDGAPIEAGSRWSRLSEPMPIGGVQITPAGQPVILLNARGTIGGYPVIATVITPDVWRLGQLRPGDEVRFSEIPFDEAREITRGAYKDLNRLAPAASATPVA